MAKGWQDGVRNRPLYWPRDYLMNGDPKARNVLALLTALFLALAVGFALVPAQPGAPVRVPIVPRSALAIAPMTVRISAAQLVKSGGDVSGLDCYACHHKESPPEIKSDAAHRIVLPREHTDLILGMRNCAECHPPSDPARQRRHPPHSSLQTQMLEAGGRRRGRCCIFSCAVSHQSKGRAMTRTTKQVALASGP